MMMPIILGMTRVICANGWTGAGLEDDLNTKIFQLEQSIDPSYETITIKDIKFDSEGHAFIIYEHNRIDRPETALTETPVYIYTSIPPASEPATTTTVAPSSASTTTTAAAPASTTTTTAEASASATTTAVAAPAIATTTPSAVSVQARRR